MITVPDTVPDGRIVIVLVQQSGEDVAGEGDAPESVASGAPVPVDLEL